MSKTSSPGSNNNFSSFNPTLVADSALALALEQAEKTRKFVEVNCPHVYPLLMNQSQFFATAHNNWQIMSLLYGHKDKATLDAHQYALSLQNNPPASNEALSLQLGECIRKGVQILGESNYCALQRHINSPMTEEARSKFIEQLPDAVIEPCFTFYLQTKYKPLDMQYIITLRERYVGHTVGLLHPCGEETAKEAEKGAKDSLLIVLALRGIDKETPGFSQWLSAEINRQCERLPQSISQHQAAQGPGHMNIVRETKSHSR